MHFFAPKRGIWCLKLPILYPSSKNIELLTKFQFFRFWCKLIMFQIFFCMFQIVVVNSVLFLFLFQTFFFNTKCTPMFFKIGNNINVDHSKRKKNWNWWNLFMNNLIVFGLKMYFWPSGNYELKCVSKWVLNCSISCISK